jgi:tyrosyl-tRNA synthetase
MSISDELMWRYYLLLTDESESSVAALRQRVNEGSMHPKAAKVALAHNIVSGFHDADSATQAQEAFEARFTRGEVDVASLPHLDVPVPAGGSVALSRVMVEAGLAASSSEATRKIQQGGVKLDREKVTSVTMRVDASRPERLLEVGRKAVRLVIGEGQA